MKKSKSKKRRNEIKYPYFVKHYNARNKQEYLDVDYVDKLSLEEKKFLNKFLGEFYAADLDFKDLKKNIHNTKDLKKDCTDRNNARNRCAYSMSKAGMSIDKIENDLYYEEQVQKSLEESFEDTVNELIDGIRTNETD